MDAALPRADQLTIRRILDAHRGEGIDYHALRTREADARRFVELHVLVPGAWSVQRGHDVVERIEAEIRANVRNAAVLIHLEPIEDPTSWADVELRKVR